MKTNPINVALYNDLDLSNVMRKLIGHRSSCVLLGGDPGTGKSYFSDFLSSKLGGGYSVCQLDDYGDHVLNQGKTSWIIDAERLPRADIYAGTGTNISQVIRHLQKKYGSMSLVVLDVTPARFRVVNAAKAMKQTPYQQFFRARSTMTDKQVYVTLEKAFTDLLNVGGWQQVVRAFVTYAPSSCAIGWHESGKKKGGSNE